MTTTTVRLSRPAAGGRGGARLRCTSWFHMHALIENVQALHAHKSGPGWDTPDVASHWLLGWLRCQQCIGALQLSKYA